MATLDDANTTAQWFLDDFPGSSVFPRLEKFVVHTTETEGWPGYAGGAAAPNATYYPRRRQTRQHFPNNRSSRALRDAGGTDVRENRDNVFQLEIVAYSDKKLGDSVGGLWIGDLLPAHYEDLARICVQLHHELQLPLQTTVTWREGRTHHYDDVRLSGPAFDRYRGILGHVHVSGNTHWDPGGFYASRLMNAITVLTQPAPPPSPIPAEGASEMILVRQDMGEQADRIWLLSATEKRHVETVTAFSTLRAHVPFKSDPPVSSQLLQSFSSQQPITDQPAPPVPPVPPIDS